MPTYILRAIDETLWRGFKAQAAREGRPMRWIMMRLVRLYAVHGLDALEAASPLPADAARGPAPVEVQS